MSFDTFVDFSPQIFAALHVPHMAYLYIYKCHMIIVQVYRDINWVYSLQVSVYTMLYVHYDEVFFMTIQIVIGVSIILMILMIMTQRDYHI